MTYPFTVYSGQDADGFAGTGLLENGMEELSPEW